MKHNDLNHIVLPSATFKSVHYLGHNLLLTTFFFKAPKSGKEQGVLPSTSISCRFKNYRSGNKYQNITDGLKHCNRKYLKPAEDASLFSDFHGPKVDEVAEFDAVPFILVSTWPYNVCIDR